MCEPRVEDAYRESGALVHTLALRSLGSVDEAEDIVRRVFAYAALSGSLASRELMHDAAERITGDLEQRVRAKLAALDEQVGADAVTDERAVLAEADRILVGASLARLDEPSRIVLTRALADGEPRFELARSLGVEEEVLDARLREAILALWSGDRPAEGHASLEGLASRALGMRVADGGREHIADCRECRSAWRSLNDLVGTIARTPSAAAVVPPRTGLWDEVRDAVDAGEPVAPVDWRGEAREREASAQRRRTLIMAAAVVASSLFVALAFALSQMWGAGDARDAVASAVLVDPRSGDEAGRAWVEAGSDGAEVVVVEGVYAEYADEYLELWILVGDDAPVSLGHVSSARYEVALPSEVATAVGATVEVSREPWASDAGLTGDVLARGELTP